MAQQRQYLSTDPNAGRASQGRSGGAGPAGSGGGAPRVYLSTDPNAGDDTPEPSEPSGLQRAAQTFLKYVPNPVGIAKGIRGAFRTATSPEALPTVGAIGGGILGGLIGNVPGAIAGAGIGGGLGKGGEFMGREARGEHIEQTVSNVFGGMATRGAGEAALQAGGGLIAKGAQKLAKPIYNLGLGAKMSLRRQHPDLAKTGIDEGIAVSKRGTAKAEGLRTASRQQADDAIGAAEKAGAAPVTARDVIRGGGFRDIADSARTRALGGGADESGAVAQRARSIRGRTRGGVPVTQAQAAKREMQSEADKVYRAAERGGAPPTINAELDKATAQGFRKAIEDRVPAVADINKRTQSLGGLTHALEDAGDKNQLMRQLIAPMGFGAASGITSGVASGDMRKGAGAGLATTALMAGMMAPSNLSRAAIGLDRFGRWNMPVHAVRAAILAALAGKQE